MKTDANIFKNLKLNSLRLWYLNIENIMLQIIILNKY